MDMLVGMYMGVTVLVARGVGIYMGVTVYSDFLYHGNGCIGTLTMKFINIGMGTNHMYIQ